MHFFERLINSNFISIIENRRNTAYLPRRALRYEFQIHARTRSALGISRTPYSHGCRRDIDAGFFQDQKVAVIP